MTAINRLLKNYCNARKSWEVWCFLQNVHLDPPQFDNPRIVKDSPLLSHYTFLAVKDFYIEMYKVLKASRNNPDNIFAQLEDHIARNTNDSIAIQALEDLTYEQEIITTVCNIRDKFYAHLDKDFQKYIYTGILVKNDIKCLQLVESAIIALTSKDTLLAHLKEVLSKEEYSFNIRNGFGTL